jgi:hypothetical protein
MSVRAGSIAEHRLESSSTARVAANRECVLLMSNAECRQSSISLFYSYSHKDEVLRDKLETHLTLLKLQGVIQSWHDRRIGAGTEWEGAIDENLEQAGIILLLISSDFLASNYCRDVELRAAMERHEQGTARVIPVILRPVDGWLSAAFGKLQAVPKNGKPVTTWKNRDEAFADVARGIREAASSLADEQSGGSASAGLLASEPALPAERPGAADRATLVQELNRLSPTDLAALVTLIDESAPHVNRHTVVPTQAAELVRWANSSAGPGLAALHSALAGLLRTPAGGSRTPASIGMGSAQIGAESGNAGNRSTGAAPLAPYFAVQRQEIERHERQFVGRGDVIQAFDRFVATHRRGYFVVTGGPGSGKSAIAAHLVHLRGLVHHMISRSGGRCDPRLILRSLLAQILPRAQAVTAIADHIPELTKTLEESLGGLAERESPLVVVIDALDELAVGPGAEIPFLVSDALQEGVFFVVTTRPDDRLKLLSPGPFMVEHTVYELAPLTLGEIEAILCARLPGLAPTKVERIAACSQGNPLYLHAVIHELEQDPDFDLRELPARIEDFFLQATGGFRGGRNPILHQVLGLLTASRALLSLSDLSQIIGARQREVFDQGIRPIQPFLIKIDGGFAFYHTRFHEFVAHELHFEDELESCHRALAAWLESPQAGDYEERYRSLAHHLYQARELDGLLEAISPEYLAEKVRRQGYAVLEDVELVARAMLERDDPASVERCVTLVDGLRAVVGGDVMDEAGFALRGLGAARGPYRSRIVVPVLPSAPGFDVYVGVLPKIEVGADFFEVVACRDRLVVALGDAPGRGLKSAFVARFLSSLFRRKSEAAGTPQPGALLEHVAGILAGNDFFETLAMQCATLDRRRGVLTIANAELPYPVLYSSRRGKCDRLPINGDLIFARSADEPAAHFDQRRVEIGPGDILVMVTDGLTESRGLGGDSFGYRFTEIIESLSARGARVIGEAILDDWRNHPRLEDDYDDVAVMVVALAADPRTPVGLTRG